MSFPETLSQLERPERILPPFLGELGYEIRSFVAMIEPWLRSGWKLPTRRPALYPEGTTLQDEAFFSKLDDLRRAYRCEPIMSHLSVFHGHRLEASELNERKQSFNRELQRTVREFVDRPGRPVTYWDSYLVRAWNGITVDYFASFHGLAPSFKPRAYVQGNPDCPRHVGVQFRLMTKGSQRNSDVETVLRFAHSCARALGIPLLCYGEESGCTMPEGLPRVSDFHPAGDPVLEGDLKCLRQCMLMIAPDSGWADLMGWLQVPTLLQKVHTPYSFYASYAHGATFGLMDPSAPVEPQVLAVLGPAEGRIAHGGAFPPQGPTQIERRYFELSSIGWPSGGD